VALQDAELVVVVHQDVLIQDNFTVG
jgi:hypothetical protein